jgi:hypothetical protein
LEKEDAVILSQHPNIAASLEKAKKTWQVYNRDHFFKEVNGTTWIEIENGITTYTFKFISQTNPQVIIYASDRNFYVQLDSTSAKWGSSVSSIANVFLYGNWTFWY